MKMVCYCADDYALNDQISHAVRTLLYKNAIQATSCMTQSPIWKEQALLLLELRAQIDHPVELGLHLNFTNAFTSETIHFPLSTLMLKAWMRSLDRDKIKQSISQQWDLFIDAIGASPDFIDGHQHIHQFPVIREILVEFLKEKNFKGWIRNLNKTISAKNYQFKSQCLEFLGAHTTYTLIQKNHFLNNPYFSGIYDFKQVNYRVLMQEWLSKAQDKTLVMCHPASDLPNEFDEIQAARIQEFEYLNSDQFLEDCQKFKIQLKPMGAML